MRVLEAVRQHRIEEISDFEIQKKMIDLRAILMVGHVHDPEHTLTFEYLKDHSVDVMPMVVDRDEKAFNVGGGNVDE